MIHWSDRRHPPAEVAVVVLTSDPAQWAEACRTWDAHGVEWCICSHVYGIGAGAGAVLNSVLDECDTVPVLCVDDTGWEQIVDDDMTPERLMYTGRVPVVSIGCGTIRGDINESVARAHEAYEARRALGWVGRYVVLIDPDPMDIAMFAAGWWARES